MKAFFVPIVGAFLIIGAIPWLGYGIKSAWKECKESVFPGWMLIGKIFEELFIYPTRFFAHTIGPLVTMVIGLILFIIGLKDL